jgi:DNA-binding GntR family transcriptional regulator
MTGLTVSRRSGDSTAPRRIAFGRRALVTDVLHRCELWTVLECHAVGKVALSPDRDLSAVRTTLPELNQQMLAPSASQEWQRLELRVHRAIADQARNPLLSKMVEEVCRGLETLWWRHTPRAGTLWLLQCQHRKILSCIEAGRADEATLHTRAHLHLMRDQLVAALNTSAVG